MKEAKIYIMSDSRAILKTLKGHSFEFLLVREFRSLQKLSSRNSIKVV